MKSAKTIQKFSLIFLASPLAVLVLGVSSTALLSFVSTTSATAATATPAPAAEGCPGGAGSPNCKAAADAAAANNAKNCTPGTSADGQVTTPCVVDQAVCDASTQSSQKLSVSVDGTENKPICYFKCNLSANGAAAQDLPFGKNTGNQSVGCAEISQNPIFKYLVKVINVLSGGVGLVVAGMIVFRGLQYSWAKDNPKVTAEAIDGIRNAVIALLLYIFGYAILNFLIPGGLIK